MSDAYICLIVAVFAFDSCVKLRWLGTGHIPARTTQALAGDLGMNVLIAIAGIVVLLAS